MPLTLPRRVRPSRVPRKGFTSASSSRAAQPPLLLAAPPLLPSATADQLRSDDIRPLPSCREAMVAVAGAGREPVARYSGWAVQICSSMF